MTIISSEKLTKAYVRRYALKDLSFSIKQNTITGLVGRNGAGKTTLLKILAGQLRNTSGSIKVFNENPFNNLFVSANTIFITDELEFPQALNLYDILHTAGSFYPKWDKDFALKLFNYFNLDQKGFYYELSKGNKSTFNMIVGLAARCPLTLFDEPTSGMDAAVRRDFYRVLLKDYIDHPRTFIISSHYLEEIEDLLEYLLLIDQGEKILHLPIEEVKDYAVSVMGPNKSLEQIPENKWISRRRVDEDTSVLIVKRDKTIEELPLENLMIKPVSPNDLCIYMTENKGGIDHVLYTSDIEGSR